jgi:hypothetical protein
MSERRLSLQQRKAIFEALVKTQDAIISVPISRQLVAEKFAISTIQVLAIEEEGLDKEWPPLREVLGA